MPRVSRSFSHVAPSSHSQPFDTALRAYSGRAVDLEQATSEPVRGTCLPPRSGRHGADRPGIRVAEHCLVISQWHLLLWPRGDRERSEIMRWVT